MAIAGRVLLVRTSLLKDVIGVDAGLLLLKSSKFVVLPAKYDGQSLCHMPQGRSNCVWSDTVCGRIQYLITKYLENFEQTNLLECSRQLWNQSAVELLAMHVLVEQKSYRPTGFGNIWA